MTIDDKRLLALVFAAASIIKHMREAWHDAECPHPWGWCSICEHARNNPPCPGYGANAWLEIVEQLAANDPIASASLEVNTL